MFLLFVFVVFNNVIASAQGSNNLNTEDKIDPSVLSQELPPKSEDEKPTPETWRLLSPEESTLKIESKESEKSLKKDKKLRKLAEVTDSGDNNKDTDEIFRMREHDVNYIIFGKPDTKVQFSFRFKFFRKTNIYIGYTQVMFWELLKEESNPFSEINFNPETFYRWTNSNALLKEIDFGMAHLSNGKDGEVSRSVDSIYLKLKTYGKYDFGIPRLQMHFRYQYNEDKTNKDITDFYGPLVLKLYFDKLAQKIFLSEEFYVEYYNGGRWAEDFSKSSVRLSARFRVWNSTTAPKVFVQYFNGYGENLIKYNKREETYRIGLSIGGF